MSEPSQPANQTPSASASSAVSKADVAHDTTTPTVLASGADSTDAAEKAAAPDRTSDTVAAVSDAAELAAAESRAQVESGSAPESLVMPAAGATEAAQPAPGVAAADAPSAEASSSPASTQPAADRPWWLPRWPEDKEARLKLMLGGLAVLLALQWWNARSDLSDLRREVAQRLQSGENLNSQTKLIADRVDDQLRVLQGKVSVLEARQSEAQNQQAALEQLYRDLAKNRDDWALAEIEQVLSTASQQLQIAGNVRTALVALQNADARLSRIDRPQFIAIRRAIAQDIEKLKSLPSVDLTGVAVRLDSLIAQVDAMPLLSDAKPAIVAPTPKTKLSNRQKNESDSAFEWRVEMQERWAAWSSELWTDLKQLLRVRTVTAPEALLLTPEQAFFARENVKLRLLNARVALLSRNDAAFRSDMAEADRALQRYFDSRDPHTRAGRELIRQIRESVLNIEMPSLSHSLAAVRQSRSRP
jgi:uroporphyrin-3 C-methyltransferase/uroporphyrinogen III methyltransferase/synthase